jgi:hypothetical protein
LPLSTPYSKASFIKIEDILPLNLVLFQSGYIFPKPPSHVLFLLGCYLYNRKWFRLDLVKSTILPLGTEPPKGRGLEIVGILGAFKATDRVKDKRMSWLDLVRKQGLDKVVDSPNMVLL